MNDSLKHKTVLITQSALRSFGGSEIVTLELANFFRTNGAKVTVFTWYYDEPIKSEFTKRSIDVTTNEYDPVFKKPFDYVWINHQVLPLAILKNLPFLISNKPKIFFYHMSALDDLYIEQPYVYNLEKSLATKSLFVSPESLSFQTNRYGKIFHSPTVFPNSSPTDYIIHTPNRPDLKKILVVSNHPPKELLDTIPSFTASNITIDFLGQQSSRYSIATPSLLQSYDCIITIGKTVQYCLTLNIPVYIYDRFGGCGFLTTQNFQKAAHTNFSGRGFRRKSSNQITASLISNFNRAVLYQSTHYNDFTALYSLPQNITHLLSSPLSIQSPHYSDHYLNYVIGAETIARQKTISDNNNAIQLREMTNLKSALAHLESNRQELTTVINSMENSRIIKLDKKIRSIPHIIKKNTNPPCSIKINHAEYTTSHIRHPSNPLPIIGLIREKNESLILKDTLDSMSAIVDGIIVLDDNSDDSSPEIAKNHPKVLAVINHKISILGDRSQEESIHRQLLLDLAREYQPTWIFYQDADERIENASNLRTFLLSKATDPNLEAIRISLFDAYITPEDSAPYNSGPLFNFRKFFGPERRDIIMAWKNLPAATFLTYPDLREPVGLNEAKIITKFHVQHYGKAISIEQWEETCDYYVKHFPQYAPKWQARKGKAIHTDFSDFRSPLSTWEQVKKTGGIKIN